MASTLGQHNPFRYRGYYYDMETGWYYLNSRYYDSRVGRFINADGIIGANGGILGYNMFAYCSNNPVMLVDPSGMVAFIDFKDSYNPTTMPWYNSGSTSGGGSGSKASPRGWRAPKMVSYKLKEDIRNFDILNDDPNVALEANYFSFYKGFLVIKTNFDNSFSYFAIFLSENDQSIDTLDHERGHSIHHAIIGPVNYIFKVGIPSLIDYWGPKPPDYFSEPQEYIADKLGGVNRSNHKYLISDEEAFWYFIYSFLY